MTGDLQFFILNFHKPKFYIKTKQLSKFLNNISPELYLAKSELLGRNAYKKTNYLTVNIYNISYISGCDIMYFIN